MPAFRGDRAVKAALLARLDRHAAAATLRIGRTCWDGVGGSPLGVSVEGESVDAYSTAYGYPLALAGLLDPLTMLMADAPGALRFARAWVDAVEPGADLTPVASSLAADLLSSIGTVDLAPALAGGIARLHARERDGDRGARGEWRALRREILAALDAMPGRRPEALLRLCEAAAWPAADSRSLLAEMARRWCELSELDDDPDWTDADRDRAQTMLDQLVAENRAALDAGAGVDIPALFRARDAGLALGFEANLTRVNARHGARARDLGARVLRDFAGARIPA